MDHDNRKKRQLVTVAPRVTSLATARQKKYQQAQGQLAKARRIFHTYNFALIGAAAVLAGGEPSTISSERLHRYMQGWEEGKQRAQDKEEVIKSKMKRLENEGSLI